MPVLLLIRHGENDYTRKGIMAGRRAGVHLNERGREQAQELAKTLAGVPLVAIYSSPLERAMETAAPIATPHKMEIIQEPNLLDGKVGKWEGKSLKTLRLTNAWKVVQHSPSRFQFPEGESFVELQARVVHVLEGVVKKYNKPKDIVAVVFHADPIKLAIAHYIGLPFDHFQRLMIGTGSVSILTLFPTGAALMALNLTPPFTLPMPPKKPRQNATKNRRP